MFRESLFRVGDLAEQVCVCENGKVSVAVGIFGSKTKLESRDISKMKGLEKIDVKSREAVECPCDCSCLIALCLS